MRDNCASFETVTWNEHSPLRFRESVALHFTSVVPIGKVSPDAGEHVTLTEPWPAVTGGVSKLTATPAGFTVARELPRRTPATGDSQRAAAVAAVESAVVGVLHAAPSASVTASADQTAQYFTKHIDMN